MAGGCHFISHSRLFCDIGCGNSDRFPWVLEGPRKCVPVLVNAQEEEACKSSYNTFALTFYLSGAVLNYLEIYNYLFRIFCFVPEIEVLEVHDRN